MREGGKKKHLGKNKHSTYFWKKKIDEGDKKNIGQISGKVNEGDEIKKKPILNKVNEQKKHS